MIFYGRPSAIMLKDIKMFVGPLTENMSLPESLAQLIASEKLSSYDACPAILVVGLKYYECYKGEKNYANTRRLYNT